RRTDTERMPRAAPLSFPDDPDQTIRMLPNRLRTPLQTVTPAGAAPGGTATLAHIVPQGVAASTPLARFDQVRGATEALCHPLATDDCTAQSMPDASPVKWHIAHTSWFFEEFVLQTAIEGYAFFDPAFRYLFNSYYEAGGPRHSRPERGLLSRPTVEQVWAYRGY